MWLWHEKRWSKINDQKPWLALARLRYTSMTEWLRQSEAASYLEISAADLTKLREHGKGPVFYKKGPLVRYTQEDLDEWVEAEFTGVSASDKSWDRVEPAHAQEPPKPADPADIFPDKDEPSPPVAETSPPVATGVNIRDPDLLAGMTPRMIAGVDAVPSKLLDAHGAPAGESPLAVRADKHDVPAGGRG